MDQFRDAVGVLSRNGTQVGYLRTTVGVFWGLGRPFGLQERIWIYRYWSDRETAEPDDGLEEYPPWTIRNDLARGIFEDEDDVVYDVEWLRGDALTAAQADLNLRD